MKEGRAVGHAVTDPREDPRYTLIEAAHYLRLAPATLSSWVRGRSYRVSDGQKRFEPLIRRPDPRDTRLSFVNLVEAFVLRALRSSYRLQIYQVRTALSHAERKYGVHCLLANEQLRAAPGQLFLQRYRELIELASAGQRAMPEILEAYLDRLVFEAGCAIRLYPIARRDGERGPRIVVIDPKISFGRPIVEAKAIKTVILAERFDVGESIPNIAADYDLKADEVEEAIRYERWSEKAA